MYARLLQEAFDAAERIDSDPTSASDVDPDVLRRAVRVADKRVGRYPSAVKR
jgi:hypothetical protein